MRIEILLKELSKKYYKKEKLMRIMVEKCKSLGYNTRSKRNNRKFLSKIKSFVTHLLPTEQILTSFDKFL